MLSDKIILAISHLFSFLSFLLLWAQLLGLIRLEVFLESRWELEFQFSCPVVPIVGNNSSGGLLVFRRKQRGCARCRSCTCARGRQNQFLQTYNYRHYANLKKLLKLRTAIVLIGWTIRIHKCGCFYWTQVRKIQLPCVLSCSSDSFWSESLDEVLSCPTSG